MSRAKRFGALDEMCALMKVQNATTGRILALVEGSALGTDTRAQVVEIGFHSTFLTERLTACVASITEDEPPAGGAPPEGQGKPPARGRKAPEVAKRPRAARVLEASKTPVAAPRAAEPPRVDARARSAVKAPAAPPEPRPRSYQRRKSPAAPVAALPAPKSAKSAEKAPRAAAKPPKAAAKPPKAAKSAESLPTLVVPAHLVRLGLESSIRHAFKGSRVVAEVARA